MDPRQFADQIAQTAQRFRERAGERARTRERVERGGPLAADTPERLAKRLERLGVEPEERDAILADVSAPPPARTRAIIDGAPVLERILGSDDLIGVGFLEAGYLAGRAVGRITVRTDGGRAFGTGSLVSPRLMMTNNHVLGSAADAAGAHVEFDFQLDLAGDPLTPVAFAFDPGAFFLTDEHLDYTLVAVAPAAGDRELDEFGFNRLFEAEGKVLLGEAVNIIQHPSGDPKRLALRENQLVDLLDDFVHYETDTAPGSSGAPVFNDQWELVALHHSGVPRTDGDGNILALDGSVWQPAMGEAQIAWIANEGARVSSILRHLKEEQNLTDDQRRLRAEVFEATPEPTSGAAAAPTAGGAGTTITVPLQITVTLGAPPAPPAPVAPPPPPAGPPPPPPAPAAEPDLAAALADLERSRRRPYYDEERDRAARESYYAGIGDDLEGQALLERLTRLLTDTHTPKPAYKPARHVYPWLDLHPDLALRSLYSGKTIDPEELIREDLAAERQRSERLRELFQRESTVGEEVLAAELDALEAAFPFNCEHVVPQSWFQKREPMRGDLHHLFACEPNCNSFRGNTPYFDFTDFEEVVRTDCGKREDNRFEPASGKGPAARAVLYFLLRYPQVVSAAEFPPERSSTLLAWHEAEPVESYELHRNQAGAELQGNRNPLVDHPEWARRIPFEAAIGA